MGQGKRHAAQCGRGYNGYPVHILGNAQAQRTQQARVLSSLARSAWRHSRPCEPIQPKVGGEWKHREHVILQTSQEPTVGDQSGRQASESRWRRERVGSDGRHDMEILV